MPATESRTRRTGLNVFGILEILIGLAYLLPLGALMLPAMRSMPDVIMAIIILAAMSIGSIWLGIGTLMVRRWARTLSLLVSWGWLVAGVFVLVYSLFVPHMAAGTLGVFVFITLVAGTFVLFFSATSVKTTFEAGDPHLRWTDKCPLPVLAVSLSYGAIAMSALMGTINNTPIPLFGIVLTGPASQAYYLLQLMMAAYLAWGMYRLSRAAWLLAVGMTAVLGASAVVSYSITDMSELYRAMEIPPDQIAMMSAQGLGTDRIALITGVLSLFWLGFLLYIKKYFAAPSRQQSPA